MKAKKPTAYAETYKLIDYTTRNRKDSIAPNCTHSIHFTVVKIYIKVGYPATRYLKDEKSHSRKTEAFY